VWGNVATFMHGPRSCIGEPYVNGETSYFMTHVLSPGYKFAVIESALSTPQQNRY
jgi:hypothetical protein